MNKSKYVGLLLAVLYIILSINSATQGGDFDVYLDAAQKMSRGEDIYLPPFFEGLQYFYSPLFALMLMPLTGNFFLAELFWLGISGYWLFRIWQLMELYFPKNVLTSKQSNLWIFLSVFLLSRLIFYNISMIQVTVFLLWGILESIRLIQKEKVLLGAALLALMINIKIVPIVVLPFLVYRGFYKASGLTLIFMGIYMFLPAIIIGEAYNTSLLQSWWSIVNPSNKEHVIESILTSQSIVGTIPVLLTESDSVIALRRNILDLPMETAIMVGNIFRVILVLLSLVFLKKPFSKKISLIEFYKGVSYILMVIPLIFPHQQKYAFLFAWPALVFLLYYYMVLFQNEPTTSLKIQMILFILFTFNLLPFMGADVIGRYAYDVIQHFRIMGVSFLGIIVLYYFASVEKLQPYLIKETK